MLKCQGLEMKNLWIVVGNHDLVSYVSRVQQLITGYFVQIWRISCLLSRNLIQCYTWRHSCDLLLRERLHHVHLFKICTPLGNKSTYFNVQSWRTFSFHSYSRIVIKRQDKTIHRFKLWSSTCLWLQECENWKGQNAQNCLHITLSEETSPPIK